VNRTYLLPTLADQVAAWLHLDTFRRMTRGARLAGTEQQVSAS